MNRWYIYKLTFMNGCTYIGKHHQIRDNDNYVTSSSYYHNKGGKDILYKREIILDNLADSDTCDIMETICILSDRASNVNNVNYNKGAWVSNYFDRGFSGKDNGMYGRKMTEVCSPEKLKEMADKRKATYAAKWADYRASHNGMVPNEYRRFRTKQFNERLRELNKIISNAHKEYNKKLSEAKHFWSYNPDTLEETYLSYIPNGNIKGRLPYKYWPEDRKKSYAEKHSKNPLNSMTIEAIEELKDKLSKHSKGRIWYTDGVNNIYALPGQDIPDDYYQGMTITRTELYNNTRRKKGEYYNG